MRIHREPTAYSENRLGDRLGCAGAACLSARNYLLSFFLSGFSPPRFATRDAPFLLPPYTPPTLLCPARTMRTPPSSRSPRLLLYLSPSSSPTIHPFALRRPHMQQLREHASCSTGNESEPPSSSPPPSSTRKGISRYRWTRNSERSIARHWTFRRELIRLLEAVAFALNGTKI